MVKARLFGNVFIDNGVGIKASGDVDIESHGSIFQGNGKAMELDSGVPWIVGISLAAITNYLLANKLKKSGFL
ncbi:hypothetical protein [Enterobacter chengduensis]|uniref:hypothetical protein n=1 Tax=Enterobacter chengduensis TaxID=2494701 RepID=UPI003D6EBABD